MTRSGSGNGRTGSARGALLALAMGAGIGAGGCAGAGRADIDRSQPDKVDKSFLLNADGTPKKFYYRLTITDVPPTNGWAFEGMQGPMDKIYFQITEDQLIGYRAYDYAPGSENPFTSGANNTDAPVVSFKIKSHFDVKREYNPGTGEQTNVISENTTDRPWSERQYMRVDWTTDKLSNPFMDITLMPATPTTGLTAISESDLTNPGRAIYTPDYLDVTLQVQAMPDYDACIKLFSASDDVGASDCGPANIKLRQSLLAVKDSEYQPLEYPDRDLLLDGSGKPISYFWTSQGAKPCDASSLDDGGGTYSGADCTLAGADKYSKFGFFRTVRQTYDAKLGATEVGRKYYANRWNIWDKTIQRDGSGAPILDTTGAPVRLAPEQRVPRQIPYYTNVEFPDDDAHAVDDRAAGRGRLERRHEAHRRRCPRHRYHERCRSRSEGHRRRGRRSRHLRATAQLVQRGGRPGLRGGTPGCRQARRRSDRERSRGGDQIDAGRRVYRAGGRHAGTAGRRCQQVHLAAQR